jgi:hypothetical protein
MQCRKDDHLRRADRPTDYKKFGVAPVEVAEFEDGQQIGVENGRYERWYFDAHLYDGAADVGDLHSLSNHDDHRRDIGRCQSNGNSLRLAS